jgi:hypothetical protein
MLRRSRPASIRRSRLAFVFFPLAAVAAMMSLSGCLQDVPQLSETCTQPTSMNDGFFENRSVFFRVSTQTSPTDPQTSWICYRVKVPNNPETAGRIDVKSTSGANVGPVTTDTNSRACATPTDNIVPAPHPVESGAVGDVSFYVDAYSNLNTAWLCVEVGSTKERVVVPIPSVGLPNVNIDFDPSPSAPQDTTPPPAGKPSTTCSTGAYGAPTEHINAHLNDRDLFLYTAQPASNEVHLCARLSGPQSGGGHLAVKASPDQVVRVDQSPDLTPCTQNVVSLTNPPESIKVSPVGQTPVSICVNATRYTVVTGPVPPVVSWTPDS